MNCINFIRISTYAVGCYILQKKSMYDKWLFGREHWETTYDDN